MFWRRCHRAPMSECSSWVLPWWRAARAPSSCWLSCSPAPAVVPALTGSALSRPSSPSQHQTIRISPKVSLLLVRLKGLSSGSKSRVAGVTLAEKQVGDGTTQLNRLLAFQELTGERRTAQTGDSFCTIRPRTSILWRGVGHAHEL